MTDPVPLAPWRRAAGGAIGLWLAPAAELLAAEADPETALPEPERIHCRRYRHPEARGRALAVRLLAHRALAWLDPEKRWSIAHLASGQPYLPDSPLAISLAHGGAWVACALGRVAALGVDLETIRPRPRLLAFARRYYSAAEVAALEALSGAEQLALFHDIWTLREAWLKARGTGLRDYRRAPCTREMLAGVGVSDGESGWAWQQYGEVPDLRLALGWQVDAGQAPLLPVTLPATP